MESNKNNSGFDLQVFFGILFIVIVVSMIAVMGSKRLKMRQEQIEYSYSDTSYRMWCDLYERNDIHYEDWVVMKKDGLLHNYRK